MVPKDGFSGRTTGPIGPTIGPTGWTTVCTKGPIGCATGAGEITDGNYKQRLGWLRRRGLRRLGLEGARRRGVDHRRGAARGYLHQRVDQGTDEQRLGRLRRRKLGQLGLLGRRGSLRRSLDRDERRANGLRHGADGLDDRVDQGSDRLSQRPDQGLNERMHDWPHDRRHRPGADDQRMHEQRLRRGPLGGLELLAQGLGGVDLRDPLLLHLLQFHSETLQRADWVLREGRSQGRLG